MTLGKTKLEDSKQIGESQINTTLRVSDLFVYFFFIITQFLWIRHLGMA